MRVNKRFAKKLIRDVYCFPLDCAATSAGALETFNTIVLARVRVRVYRNSAA